MYIKNRTISDQTSEIFFPEKSSSIFKKISGSCHSLLMLNAEESGAFSAVNKSVEAATAQKRGP